MSSRYSTNHGSGPGIVPPDRHRGARLPSDHDSVAGTVVPGADPRGRCPSTRCSTPSGTPPAAASPLFVGVVRDHDHGQSVTALDYSAHPTAPAPPAPTWPTRARRSARGAVAGGPAPQRRTWTSATSPSSSLPPRRTATQAFAACRDLIDTLKAEVPIWKHQHLGDGCHGVGGYAVSPSDPCRSPERRWRHSHAASPTSVRVRPDRLFGRAARSSGLITAALRRDRRGAGLSFVPCPMSSCQPGPDHQHPRPARRQAPHRDQGRPRLPRQGRPRLHHGARRGRSRRAGQRVRPRDRGGARRRGDLPARSVLPRADDRKEAQQESAAEMADSQEVAAAIALRETGHVVPERRRRLAGARRLALQGRPRTRRRVRLGGGDRPLPTPLPSRRPSARRRPAARCPWSSTARAVDTVPVGAHRATTGARRHRRPARA